MRLRWSRSAQRDIESALSYLQREAPEAVELVFNRLWDATQLLSGYPMIGRPGRVYGTREWIVQDTSYLIGYRVSGDALLILRVLHSRQRWPKRLG